MSDNTQKNTKMAITQKGLRLLLIGVIVMIAGYLLMMGGNSGDPNTFSEDIFDFQRLVAAPVVSKKPRISASV
jgi:hypothetical protein